MIADGRFSRKPQGPPVQRPRRAHQCLRWVNRVVLTVRRPLPLHPDNRTYAEQIGMSQTCPTGDIASYSITSSARARKAAGIAIPNASVVFMLMTNSNLVGCSTGISSGFVPRKILSVISAARPNRARKFGP
jgi:hypothetical protein